MSDADSKDPIEDLEQQLESDRALTLRGWGVEGTVGDARLMIGELENGWARLELYWRSGPEYHEVSVDIDPAVLIQEVKRIAGCDLGGVPHRPT